MPWPRRRPFSRRAYTPLIASWPMPCWKRCDRWACPSSAAVRRVPGKGLLSIASPGWSPTSCAPKAGSWRGAPSGGVPVVFSSTDHSASFQILLRPVSRQVRAAAQPPVCGNWASLHLWKWSETAAPKPSPRRSAPASYPGISSPLSVPGSIGIGARISRLRCFNLPAPKRKFRGSEPPR